MNDQTKGSGNMATNYERIRVQDADTGKRKTLLVEIKGETSIHGSPYLVFVKVRKDAEEIFTKLEGNLATQLYAHPLQLVLKRTPLVFNPTYWELEPA